MKITMVGDKVLVRPSEEPSVTKGGLHIPDAAKEKPVKGTVLAVGPGKILPDGTRVPSEVKVGVTIFYQRYAGSEVKVEEEKLLILREEDILAFEE
jgi:chaperonin GroES